MPSVRGRSIREAYAEMGLTRREFAERADLHPETLTNITGGAACSYPVAVRIARALGWSVTDVLACDEKAVAR